MYAILHNTAARNEKLREEGYVTVDIDRVSLIPTLPDVYALLLSLALLPLSMVVWTLLTMTLFVPAVMGWVYLQCMPWNTLRFRGRWFHLIKSISMPFGMAAFALGTFWWACILFASYFFTVPVLIVRLLLGQHAIIRENFRHIYRFCKWGSFNYEQTFRGCLGMMLRVGFWDALIGTPFMGGYASAITMIPIAKYIWVCNPFLYELEEAYLTQWGPKPREDVDLDFFWRSSRDILGVAKWDRSLQITEKVVRKWFTAFYCYGDTIGNALQPDGTLVRRNSLGFKPIVEVEEVERATSDPSLDAEAAKAKRIAEDRIAPFGPNERIPDLDTPEVIIGTQHLNLHPKLFAFTYTVYAKWGDPCKSENAGQGIVRVDLTYTTLHFLTGYVEANVTKEGGLEHPMWCVVPKRGILGRDVYEFCNMLFIPFIRQANEQYQPKPQRVHL